MGERLPAEFAVSRGSVASSWRLLKPPSQLWEVASSAIGGWGDKASCFFFSLLRPLEGNHLPFWNPSPTKPPHFPQLGLKKCFHWYRETQLERIAGRKGEETRRAEWGDSVWGSNAEGPRESCFSTLEGWTPGCASLSGRDRAEMLYHDHPVLIKPYQIYVSEQESQEVGTCKCMFHCRRVVFFFSSDGFVWVILGSDQCSMWALGRLFQMNW